MCRSEATLTDLLVSLPHSLKHIWSSNGSGTMHRVRIFSSSVYLWTLTSCNRWLSGLSRIGDEAPLPRAENQAAVKSFLSRAACVLGLVAQSCLTLCDPTDCSPPGSYICGDSPGKNAGVGCHVFYQSRVLCWVKDARHKRWQFHWYEILENEN